MPDIDKEIPETIKNAGENDDAWRNQFRDLISAGLVNNIGLLFNLINNDKGIKVSEGATQSDTWYATYKMILYYMQLLPNTKQ